MANALKFAPLAGSVDTSFFGELGRRKLHDYGLDDAPVQLYGALARAERREVASPLSLSAGSFTADGTGVPSSLCVAPGTLHNANTLEDFKDWDKKAMMQTSGQKIADDIASGLAVHEPERLLRFLLLTFADLKTHKFYYWFAFPAFAMPPPTLARPPTPLAEQADPTALHALRTAYGAMARAENGCVPAF